MTKSLIICDQVMYGALLVLIFVFPYSFALIEVCLMTIILAWVCRQACHPQGLKFPSSMGWSLIAIALLIVLTIPFSHNPALSLKKFFSRFLQQIFLMYVVTQIINSRRRLCSVLLVLLATLLFIIVDVTVQYMTGTSLVHHRPLIVGRVSGPMNHPNDLGTLLVTVLPVVLISIVAGRKCMPWVGTAIISALFLLLVSALGLTDSRGAWIAFVVSMVALGVYLRSRGLIICVLSMLIIFFGIFGMHCLSTRTDLYSGSMTQGSMGAPSGSNALKFFMNPSDRGFYWGTAVGVIKHYPWFGGGYDAYTQTLRDLHVGHEEYAHDSLLQITAELGFIGLILYGWFFTALFLQIKNVLRIVSNDRKLFLIGCGLASGILAWAVHSLLDTPWSSLQLGILWWLFIGILLSLPGLSSGETSKEGLK